MTPTPQSPAAGPFQASLAGTPNALRPHIAFFGRRNAGKSSLVNRVTGQSLSLVSPEPGTTTDPVYKAMELLPAGPVVIIDTPGYDDEGPLGDLRVEKTRQVLDRADLAVLVIDASRHKAPDQGDKALLDRFRARRIPFLVVYNKWDTTGTPGTTDTGTSGTADTGTSGTADTGTSGTADTENPETADSGIPDGTSPPLHVSALTGAGITELKEAIAGALTAGRPASGRPLAADLIAPGDRIVLVIPLDEAAPKGRLILPQQLVLREALEAGGIVTCCRPDQLARTMEHMSAPGTGSGTELQPAPGEGRAAGGAGSRGGAARGPALVITDSQVFREVAEILPPDTPLTSFSILMARYKGFLDTALEGIRAVADLGDGDRVLIAEGCTHHRQCSDIGTVKIPRWLREHCGGDFVFDTVSGREYPEDLTPYRLVIHCGGCMLTEREVIARMERTVAQSVPFLNYGILIAYMNGILGRCIQPLQPH